MKDIARTIARLRAIDRATAFKCYDSLGFRWSITTGRQTDDRAQRGVAADGEFVDRLDISRATVYRRLDRLESAGVVERSTRIGPDGHHRKYLWVVERLGLVFSADGVTLEAGE